MVDIDLIEDSKFIDKLVSLIPAKHYLADPDERVDLRHMKKKDRIAAREQFKKQHKEHKKASLNPSTAKGTLELLREKSSAAAATTTAPQPPQQQQQPRQPHASSDNPGVADREALRAKLQARLEDMRRQRKADETTGKKGNDAKQWRDKALEEGRKKAAEKRKSDALKQGKQTQQQQQQRAAKKQRHEKGTHQQPQAQQQQQQQLTFSKVDFGGGSDRNALNKRKKKPSKVELLADAERRRQQQQHQHQQEGEGKEAWDAAFKRAQGEKVLDDPKLLRRSIKKDEKLKKKKTQAWAERIAKQKEEQNSKQAKRKTNLQRRVDAKKEAKKAKREKKLVRAGFEGRRQGFITSPSPNPK